MLDQLVESRTGGSGNSRSGFLLTTLLIVFGAFFGIILLSMFGKFDDGKDIGRLVADDSVEVPAIVEEEPKPEPEKEPEKPQKEAPANADVRKEIIQDINESPQDVPEKVSVEKPVNKARNVNNLTVQGDSDIDARSPAAAGSQPTRVVAGGQGIGGGNSGGGGGGEPEETPPPVIKTPTPKTPEPTPPPVPKVVSGGVVNGKAINLVKPPYPPAAKAVRASGAVNVQVTIDENGNVISASAVSGHALLRGAAESAARASKFSPTMLSGQKVKVTGVIIYNFAAQ
jgi:protein TonB